MKPNGEMDVCCPFEHEKGFEKNPSAHVNLNKAVFHCKTCQAEGRLDNGGLSEISFISKLYGISYEDAIQYFSKVGKESYSEASWHKAVDALLQNNDAVEYLKSRGLDEGTIKEYELGYVGSGIVYPVFINGVMCDRRTYQYVREEHEPKILSQKGASPLLFPFDIWMKDERETILCAGENDALLARKHGFNAITATAGEGQFPKLFLSFFKNKDVFVCYDCDEAGRVSSRKVAFLLKEAGANVKLIDLGLEGTRESKDITDFFVKHKKQASDFKALIDNAIDYNDDLSTQDKNKAYPLVNLANVTDGKYSGRRISSRVVLSGTYDQVFQIPTAVEWKCNGAILDDQGRSPCHRCMHKDGEGWWSITENLKDLMYLTEVTEAVQHKNINTLIGLPEKCPNASQNIRARKPVTKVIFTPDVESDVDNFKDVEQHAYVLGLTLEDGNKYRAFFKTYPHPNNGQRVYLVVDRVEDSDNAINSFKMTPEIKEQLSIFSGDTFEMMKDRYIRHHDITNIFKPQEIVANAVDIMYHSVLEFKFNGMLMKGQPEGLIVGEARTGKTQTAEKFMKYIGIGNMMALKGATTAGLLGGADKLQSGGYKVTWGTIPRNNKGLVIMDELSGMSRDVMASLTAMRSEQIATVHKIAKGKAPARTRLLWLSNPRVQANGQSRSIRDYSNGIQILLDLIGSDEDIARFDFATVIVKNGDSSPHDDKAMEAHAPELYRNLVLWAWSRKPDQVIISPEIERYAVSMANELNERFDTDIKLFGGEAWKKITRIAVASACATFSTDESGENVVLTKNHVDWACDFLTRCYDNPIFRLKEYVAKDRSTKTVNQSVLNQTATICKTYPMTVKTLMEALEPVSMFNLESVSGVGKDDFKKLISSMSASALINVSSHGVEPTRRMRLAVEHYRGEQETSTMIPLTQRGVGI